jgi:LPXTG-motif cell wall-anchored protein
MMRHKNSFKEVVLVEKVKRTIFAASLTTLFLTSIPQKIFAAEAASAKANLNTKDFLSITHQEAGNSGKWLDLQGVKETLAKMFPKTNEAATIWWLLLGLALIILVLLIFRRQKEKKDEK